MIKRLLNIKLFLIDNPRKHPLLMTLCLLILSLLIYQNIQLIKLQKNVIPDIYGYTISDISKKVDSIDSSIDGFGPGTLTEKADSLSSDMIDVKSQLRDIQDKLDDLWYKLY